MNAGTMPRHERRHHERRTAAQDHKHSRQRSPAGAMAMGGYGRFAAMVATSTAIGFAATYLNVFELDHVFFSWTRLFMALVMGGVMTAVMMLFMWGMYPNKRANWAVMGVAVALFAAGVALA